jgi:hypothetical protein
MAASLLIVLLLALVGFFVLVFVEGPRPALARLGLVLLAVGTFFTMWAIAGARVHLP